MNYSEKIEVDPHEIFPEGHVQNITVEVMSWKFHFSFTKSMLGRYILVVRGYILVSSMINILKKVSKAIEQYKILVLNKQEGPHRYGVDVMYAKVE